MWIGEHIFQSVKHKKIANWIPQIGDGFPDFQAITTKGPIRFFDWSYGHWCFVFSHQAAFTPVCTSEMVALAAARQEFELRNVKLLGFTALRLEEQNNWHDDIRDKFGLTVDFPIVNDQHGALARTFGMIYANESISSPIRKSFVLDPHMRIRMIFEYPIYIGRSTEEVLRSIDALQAIDKHDIATLADWKPGNDYRRVKKLNALNNVKTYGGFAKPRPDAAVVEWNLHATHPSDLCSKP